MIYRGSEIFLQLELRPDVGRNGAEPAPLNRYGDQGARMLEKAREYARNAGEAVDLAGKLETGPERLALMHMAETWLRLAEAALDHARFMSMEARSGASDPTAPASDAP